MSDPTTLVGAFGLAITGLVSALVWMTLGRLADRKEAEAVRAADRARFDAEIARIQKEHTADLRAEIEAREKSQAQMVRVAETGASAITKAADAMDRFARSGDRTTDVVGTVLQDVVRKAMSEPQMRKAFSVDKLPALIERLRDDDREEG